jgi:hypothetical protein
MILQFITNHFICYDHNLTYFLHLAFVQSLQMADGKWMFGASSKVDLSDLKKEKRTFFNRDMPSDFSEGGLQIGTNENTSNSRKQNQLSYKAQLDFDRINNVADNLPDARKKSAYDFSRKDADSDDHPLGRSSMSQLGTPSNYRPPRADMAELASKKRAELGANRYDIITSLAKATDSNNTPRFRNQQELLVGMPINGNDDGILEIGSTAEVEKSDKKAKQRAYMDQLNADMAASGRISAPNSARRGYDIMQTDRSVKRIEHTGATGYQIGGGMSRDMSASMKNIAMDVKRQQQAKYREQLQAQQADNAYHKSVASARDAQYGVNDLPPYMQ